MKNIILNICAVILFLGIASVASAISVTTLKGKVVDKETLKPVAYANISIYNKCNEELVSGDMSNKDGEFELKAAEGSNYYVVVSHLGYKSNKIDYIDFVNKYKNFEIEVEVETKEVALEEIIIIGERIDDVASSLESVEFEGDVN